MKNNFFKKGFLTVELVLGVTIAVVVIVSIFNLMQISLRISNDSVDKTVSAYLVEEGAEAMKILRDNNWSNISSLSSGTTYYLNFSSNTWSTTTTANTIGKFTRRVSVSDVYRDSNDDISSSGTLDSGTKEVTIEVSWTNSVGSTKTETVTFYITDLYS